ncbi:MAG TPA: hypothetical protein VK457_15470 [Chloroflexota bacterium]|nr:hypothetical protein [Chloroflexota bacterium]
MRRRRTPGRLRQHERAGQPGSSLHAHGVQTGRLGGAACLARSVGISGGKARSIGIGEALGFS